MAPERDLSSTRDQASKVAAAYGMVPMEDCAKKPQPLEEEIQNPDLDRAFDEMVESYRTKRPPDNMKQFPGGVGVPLAEAEIEGTSGCYECPECGHANPSESHFCGMCGAEHGKSAATPTRRVTDESSLALNITATGGIRHFHHHYHHNHYRTSPYVVLSIVMLLAVTAWHVGWEYGVRASMRPATLTARPMVQPVPGAAKGASSAEAGDRTLEANGTRSAKQARRPDRNGEDEEVVWIKRPPAKARPQVRSNPR